jgi:hypothetical protein
LGRRKDEGGTARMKTRVQIAKRECTTDPIFLMQTRQILGVNEEYHGEIEYDSDAESYRYKGRKVSESYLIKNDMLITAWRVEGVYLTREEAEAEGKRRSYYYGKKGQDWRVYCVCARGELAKLLISADPAKSA